jgi:glutathione peroxidase-family protein
VVNVASKWGRTEANYKVQLNGADQKLRRAHQPLKSLYLGLQDFATLEEKFAGQGLMIVAFPW